MDLETAIASPEYLVDPHRINHRLRAEEPVHWSSTWDGWLVSRYADAKAVLDRHSQFSSGSQVTKRLEYLLRDLPDEARASLMKFWGFQGLFQSDPPSYLRYRNQMIKALTPRLEKVEPRVQEVTNGLLDRALEAGHIDLVADFGAKLPSTILLELLGIAPDEWSMLMQWADTLTQTFSDPTGKKALESTATLEQGFVWARRVLEERRSNPSDDILSIIATVGDFETVDERDILSTAVFLLTAGQNTLASLIPVMVYLLLKYPQQLKTLTEQPDTLAGAVEEALRIESPIQQLGRVVVQDVELGGQQLKAGDMVFSILGAANRDPAVFENPDQFDIRRVNLSRHIAFGHGVHLCVGASLARLEARLAVPSILQRLPGLELDGEIAWQPNTAFRVPTTLPLRFATTAVY